MAASKFNPDTCQTIAELVFDGLTIKDAARTADVREKTVKGWITKGRQEEAGPYRDFVNALDEARQEATEREQPMDADELKLAVSRAAKKGSVAAQKLLWEMLKVDKGSGEEQPRDPFEELDGDEVAAARERRKST